MRAHRKMPFNLASIRFIVWSCVILVLLLKASCFGNDYADCAFSCPSRSWSSISRNKAGCRLVMTRQLFGISRHSGGQGFLGALADAEGERDDARRHSERLRVPPRSRPTATRAPWRSNCSRVRCCSCRTPRSGPCWASSFGSARPRCSGSARDRAATSSWCQRSPARAARTSRCIPGNKATRYGSRSSP